MQGTKRQPFEKFTPLLMSLVQQIKLLQHGHNLLLVDMLLGHYPAERCIYSNFTMPTMASLKMQNSYE